MCIRDSSLTVKQTTSVLPSSLATAGATVAAARTSGCIGGVGIGAVGAHHNDGVDALKQRVQSCFGSVILPVSYTHLYGSDRKPGGFCILRRQHAQR